MANRVRVLDSAAGRDELERRMRAKSAPARTAERARIVLLSAQGYSGVEIAERVGCSEPAMITWRRCYAEQGLAGLDERPVRGRPPVVDDDKRAEILSRTLTAPL